MTVEATAPRELIAERDTLTGHGVGVQPGKDAVRARAAVIPRSAGERVDSRRRCCPIASLDRRLSYRAGSDPTFPWWLKSPRYRRHVHAAARGDGHRRRSALQTRASTRSSASAVSAFPFAPGRSSIALPTRCAARSVVRWRPFPRSQFCLQHDVEYARANSRVRSRDDRSRCDRPRPFRGTSTCRSRCRRD